MSSNQSEITPLTITYGNKDNQMQVGFYEVEEKNKEGKPLKRKLVEKNEGVYEWENYSGKTLFIYIKPTGDNFSEIRRPAKFILENGNFIHEKERYKKAYDLFLTAPKEQNQALDEKNKEIEELRKQLEEQQEKVKKKRSRK